MTILNNLRKHITVIHGTQKVILSLLYRIVLPCFSPQVILLLAQSEAFEFVLADRGDVAVVNAQKLTLGSHMSASALFPIRPVALGVMDISVDAVSAEASDSLVWTVLVKVWFGGNIRKYL